MTTREIYFHAYMLCDKTEGKLYYTQMIEDLEVPQSTGWLVMHRDYHESNIDLMKDLETQHGFMFWNLSTECDKWLNQKSIDTTQQGQKNVIAAFVFEQR